MPRLRFRFPRPEQPADLRATDADSRARTQVREQCRLALRERYGGSRDDQLAVTECAQEDGIRHAVRRWQGGTAVARNGKISAWPRPSPWMDGTCSTGRAGAAGQEARPRLEEVQLEVSPVRREAHVPAAWSRPSVRPRIRSTMSAR